MTTDPQVEREVRALFDEVEAAWAAGDLARYGSYYTEDAGYIARTGQLYDGRAEIEGGHAVGFAGAFKGTRMRITPIRVRPICDTHVLVHARLHTATSADDAGLDAVTTALLQRTPEGLRIAAVHTMNV